MDNQTEALRAILELVRGIATRCEFNADSVAGEPEKRTFAQVAADLLNVAALIDAALALPAEARTPQDYAIEFGEYLAKAAENYQREVNAAYGIAKITNEPDFTAMSESYRALNCAIYEFRKRKDRVITAEADAGAEDAKYLLDTELREGGYYRRRDGAVVGPLTVQAHSLNWPWFIRASGSYDRKGRFNGMWDSPYDLILRATATPPTTAESAKEK